MAGRIILFTVARLVKRKGQDKVIAAVKDLIQRDLRIHYYIAGAGPDREYLEKMAQGCANIHFLGLVSDEEKWAWLGACDIFVMPARDEDGDYEGFGIVYLEAALAGKPVIAGRAGGVAEAVLDGKTGLLVQGESVNEIKTAILRLAGDKELRERLGKTGKERAEREFGWERQIGKIYKIIN